MVPSHDDDESYFDNRDVLDRISRQYDRIAAANDLPDWAAEQYPKGRPALNGSGKLECSLISSVAGAPGISFGHVIDLPHFGKIFLGELKVEREPGNPSKGIYDAYKFHLTMIRLQMGCLAEGNISVTPLDSNGQGSKGGRTTKACDGARLPVVFRSAVRSSTRPDRSTFRMLVRLESVSRHAAPCDRDNASHGNQLRR